MKKFVMLTITVLYCHNTMGRVVPVPSAVRLMKVKTTAAAHKAAWFDLVDNIHNKKTKLLKQIHQDWANYGTQEIMSWNNIRSCADDAKEQVFNAELSKVLSLHKSHMELWKALAEENYNAMQSLTQKQENDLSNF